MKSAGPVPLPPPNLPIGSEEEESNRDEPLADNSGSGHVEDDSGDAGEDDVDVTPVKEEAGVIPRGACTVGCMQRLA